VKRLSRDEAFLIAVNIAKLTSLWNSRIEVDPRMADYDSPFAARQEQYADDSKRENGACRARRRNPAWARIGNISLGVWILTIPFVLGKPRTREWRG
jgi:hypothetical protein